MARIVIFGAGDIARLALYYFTRDSPHEVVAFCVDPEYRRGSEYLGRPLIASDDVTSRYPPESHQMFVAISYARVNKLREAKYQAAKALGYTLASYVSSRATVLNEDPCGDNCFILENNTIQPFVKIGSNVTLWSGNHVGHDSTIGDHCFIASHVVISGHCTIGPRVFMGVNATLRNGIAIGAGSVIGAGAVVMKDTAEDSVLVGRPAAPLDKRSDAITL